MKFDINKIYYMHLSPAKFGNLSSSTINEIFSDGRYISPFMEALVDHEFENLSYIKGNKEADQNFESHLPLEQRGFSLKRKTADLIPSNMIGAGRAYDEEKYAEKLNAISAFAIVYPIQNYQNLLVFAYPAAEILKIKPLPKKLTEQDLPKILGTTPQKIYDHVSDPNKITIIEDVMYEFNKPWRLL